VSRVPFSTANVGRFPLRVEGGLDDGVGSPEFAQTSVSPGYFETVGMSIVRGRPFERSDHDANSEPAAVINEALARYLFGGDDPVGKRFAQQQFNGQWGPWIRVVGVARNTRELGLARLETHLIYRPSGQSFPGQSVLIRATGDPTSAVQHVTGLVRELDRERPVENVTTLEKLRSEDLAPPRLNATLFAAFGGLALVIAAVGVFGVLAFAVSQRTREFGLRMALGAREMQVLGMVLREGGIMAAIALALGAGGALLLSNFLRGLLFQVTSEDPATYVGVGALLLSVALLAAYLPARRATRADPAEALRAE
jgi:putative ABC transport system permease protein